MEIEVAAWGWSDLAKPGAGIVAGRTHKYFGIFKEAFRHWSEDKAQRLAAALSYYTLFSLAPSLIIVVGLVGLIIDQKRVETEIAHQVELLLGSDGAGLVRQMLENRTDWNNSLFATSVGLATLLFGASGVFAQLQSALNFIWGVRAKPHLGMLNFLRRRVFAFAMLLVVGFMLTLFVVLSTWLVLIDGWLRAVMPELHLIFNVGNVVLSFTVTMLLFALLFKIMPDVTIRWHDIWVGAAVTALLFNLGKWGIGLYLGNSALTRTFGAGGALVALLVWIYYSAQIVLYGAEFIKVFATQRGRAVLPAAHAINVNWTPEDATLTD
ncbi:MAG: YihY/virulence factor BrkB family protein [Caldilineaceae bacterium]|nr:YihY/virulence factor BrkB family protein [Caldilineaceae bacterium]